MGNSDSKKKFLQCIEQLSDSSHAVTAGDTAVWDQLFQEQVSSVQEIFNILQAKDIKKLKEEAPENLAKLCCKVQCTINRSFILTLMIIVG